MYVCLCKGITDSHIKEAIDKGAKSYRDVRRATGVGKQCGNCSCVAREITHECLDSGPSTDENWYSAAQ